MTNFSKGVRTTPPQAVNGVYSVSGNAKFGDTAYLPGSGPTTEYCKYCTHIRHNRNASAWGRCAKAAEMRRQPLNAMSLIPLLTLCCKYFEKRTDTDKPWLKIKKDAA